MRFNADPLQSTRSNTVASLGQKSERQVSAGKDREACRSLRQSKEELATYPLDYLGEGFMAEKTELLPGTLDLLVLRVLSRGELHGWGITNKLEQLSKRALQVDEGSLYPALYRMEDKGWIEAEWKKTENNRRAKYYALTRSGRKQLEVEQKLWDRTSSIIAMVLNSA